MWARPDRCASLLFTLSPTTCFEELPDCGRRLEGIPQLLRASRVALALCPECRSEPLADFFRLDRTGAPTLVESACLYCFRSLGLTGHRRSNWHGHPLHRRRAIHAVVVDDEIPSAEALSAMELPPDVRTVVLPAQRTTPTLKTLVTPRCRHVVVVSTPRRPEDGPDVYDDTIRWISAECPNLLSIHVCEPVGIDTSWCVADATWIGLARGCPHLTSAIVRDMKDTLVNALATHCPLLSKVGVITAVSNENIDLLTRSCPRLRMWVAASCRGVEPVGGTTLGSRCPRLHTLQMAGARWRKFEGFHRSMLENGLRRCAHLTRVSLCSFQNACDDSVVLALAHGCPLLRHLAVSFTSVSNVGIMEVAMLCPHLQHLETTGTTVGDDGIIAVANGCPELRTLKVGHVRGRVTDGSVLALAANSRCLTQLDVAANVGISDGAFIAIAESCSLLSMLDIRRCGMTDAGFFGMVSLLPRITHVWAAESRLTDASVAALVARHGASLVALDVSGCETITNAALTEVVDHCTVLTRLTVGPVRESTLRAAWFALPDLVELFHGVVDTETHDPVTH